MGLFVQIQLLFVILALSIFYPNITPIALLTELKCSSILLANLIKLWLNTDSKFWWTFLLNKLSVSLELISSKNYV